LQGVIVPINEYRKNPCELRVRHKPGVLDQDADALKENCLAARSCEGTLHPLSL
jgi:hypothetical protein